MFWNTWSYLPEYIRQETIEAAFSERISDSEFKATFYKRDGTTVDKFKCVMSSCKGKTIAYRNRLNHIANFHDLLEAEFSREDLATVEIMVKYINHPLRCSNTKTA